MPREHCLTQWSKMEETEADLFPNIMSPHDISGCNTAELGKNMFTSTLDTRNPSMQMLTRTK